jgi:hypothetical protein
VSLIVEDGTNVAGANTYADEATIIAYAAARGVTIDPGEVVILAIKSMDYLETKSYKGNPTFIDQALDFPRDNLFVEDTCLPNDTVPQSIAKAQCEGVMALKAGIELLPNRAAEAAIKVDKTGPLSTEYFGPAPIGPDLPRLQALLQPFLSVGNFLSAFRA